MNFKRLLYLFGVKEAFRERLMESGMAPEQAHKAAHIMNPSDIEQVSKDLARTPKIIVHDEATGLETLIPKDKTEHFKDIQNTKSFLNHLASGHEDLEEYLSQYLHQGGFLNASELLMTYYFGTQAPDQSLLLSTSNRVAMFTIHKDGSLSFEEKFDIQSIKTSQGLDYRTPDNSPIASFSLTSTLQIANNHIEHSYTDLEMKAHDKAAKKLFNDPRGPFAKFFSWFKNTVKSLFSKTAREHNKKIKTIPSPTKKL